MRTGQFAWTAQVRVRDGTLYSLTISSAWRLRLEGVAAWERLYRVMNRFLSNATNKIDAKGRVSVPSAFRAVLSSEAIEELYCFQDFHYPAINIGGPELLARLEKRLQDMDPFALESNRMSLLVHGGGVFMKLDSEGRLMVTEFIRSYTGIENEATFVGRAEYFQLWRPDMFQDAQRAAREELRKRGPGS